MNPKDLCTFAQAQKFCADAGAAGGGCPAKLTEDGNIPGDEPGIFIPLYYGPYSDKQPDGQPQYYHARFENGFACCIGMWVNEFGPNFPNWKTMLAQQANLGSRR